MNVSEILKDFAEKRIKYYSQLQKRWEKSNNKEEIKWIEKQMFDITHPGIKKMTSQPEILNKFPELNKRNMIIVKK